MREKPIRAVKLRSEHILEVFSANGSVIRLNMTPFLSTVRFRLLADDAVWHSGTTDGIRVCWPGVAEMSYEEITQRAFW